MLVFNGMKTYEEFVRAIGNGMTSDTFEAGYGFAHIKGFDYLTSIRDRSDQDKIMNSLKLVDKELNFSKKNNEMYKKLTFFLKVGILFGEYRRYMEELSPLSISTLVTESLISFRDDEAKSYIPICANEELLSYVANECEYADVTNILYAVCQHYDQNPFDINDEKKLKKFQKNEIKRLKANQEEFLSDAKTFEDLASEVSRTMMH